VDTVAKVLRARRSGPLLTYSASESRSASNQGEQLEWQSQDLGGVEGAAYVHSNSGSCLSCPCPASARNRRDHQDPVGALPALAFLAHEIPTRDGIAATAAFLRCPEDVAPLAEVFSKLRSVGNVLGVRPHAPARSTRKERDLMMRLSSAASRAPAERAAMERCIAHDADSHA